MEIEDQHRTHCPQSITNNLNLTIDKQHMVGSLL